MARSRRLFGAVLLLTAAHSMALPQATLTSLIVNGPDSLRINIVILSEGYKQTQLTRFITDANAVLTKLFNTPPFKEYASYFNAYGISVASKDSGADHPPQNDYRDTYFNATYFTSGVERLLTISGQGHYRVDSLLQVLMPAYDIVLVVVNDPEYGGSGGSLAVISTHSSSPDIGIHELGHSFAQLGDEYSDAYSYPDIEEPNTTRDTVRATIKWRQWILSSTPIPTTTSYPGYASVVGLFEGAHYHTTGWYRPKYSCEMRSLFNAFCEVCRQELVLSMYERVSSVSSSSPANPSVSLVGTNSATFSVTLLAPATHGFSIQWSHDSVPIAGATSPSLTRDGYDFGNGTHVLRADIRDTTAYVRTDPMSVLKDSVLWTVNVTGVVTGLMPELGIPEHFALLPNYPNPFNPGTVIRYQVSGDSGQSRAVSLKVFDVVGREVATLVEGSRSPGVYEVRFDGTNLSSGVYFCRLQAGSFTGTQKLVLMK
jgi:hypothetical protein